MSETPGADTLELERRAKIKAGMLRMCEPVEFGSDAAIIEELVDALASLRAEKEELRRERDEARAKAEKDLREAGAHFAKSCEMADRALTAESLLAEAGGIIGRALEELRLIRMKDSGAVYDTTLRLEASAVATRIASLTKEPAHAE